ncbi:hypothetical protein SPHINGOT1_200098 [Sphingomonas sp. T1]|nr:hypothetical protein SPHINGOT1_200098 [Sphingomonas sp. T1]
METMERVTGIEPVYSAWKAAVLPLYYTREAGVAAACAPALTVAKARRVAEGVGSR